jgi:hypothetical protein
MTELSDRRQEKRKVVMAFTLVYDLENGKLLGYLRDLTMKGAQVNGEKTLEINKQVTLSIEMPEGVPEVKEKRLNIPARVARCVRDEESSSSYEIGFAFTELKPEQIQVMEKLLERYHFRHKLY